VGVLEYTLSLARDLAYIWPRGPHQYYLCATPPSINVRTNSINVDELAKTSHYTTLASPSEKTYSSIDKVIVGINTFAGPRDYAVVKGRTNKNKNKTRIKK
jgi:hypothetical protein